MTCGVVLAGADLGGLGCGRVDTVVGAIGSSGPPPTPDAAPPAPDAACQPSSFYLDIASAQLAGGFTLQTDPSAPNGEYLSPPSPPSLQQPGDASAEYALNVACTGDYLIWGRIHGPGVDNNTFWFRIDDGTFYVWRLSTGVIWYWKAATSGTAYDTPLHFALDAGAHQLVFRNAATGVGLAGLYVAIPGDVPPGNDTPCDPPDSIQLEDGGCERSCGSWGGNTCSATACAMRTQFPSYDCSGCCYVPPDAGVGDAAADAALRDAASD